MMGLEVELEDGVVDPKTNMTNTDTILRDKIAWAHLYQRIVRLQFKAGDIEEERRISVCKLA